MEQEESMSVLDLEELATWTDDMPFCPGQLDPVIILRMDGDPAEPVSPVYEAKLITDLVSQPRVFQYRVCGI